MINGDFDCFFETISCGMEVYLTYRNRKYFAQGWWDKEAQQHFFCVEDITDNEDRSAPAEPVPSDCAPYVWSIYSDSMEANALAFLDAKIFFGRSFREAEDEIEWGDE